MAFPISVRFNNSLKTTITSDNEEQILQYIKKQILEDNADNVVAENKCVSYKGSTSNRRGSLFGSVDSGIFTLFYQSNSWILNYQINMYELFGVTAIMATTMGVFISSNGGPWWVGIVAFLWLCGANWVIILVRHDGLATSIATGIDELICGKEEQPIEDDKLTGPLKSWF